MANRPPPISHRRAPRPIKALVTPRSHHGARRLCAVPVISNSLAPSRPLLSHLLPSTDHYIGTSSPARAQARSGYSGLRSRRSTSALSSTIDYQGHIPLEPHRAWLCLHISSVSSCAMMATMLPLLPATATMLTTGEWALVYLPFSLSSLAR